MARYLAVLLLMLGLMPGAKAQTFINAFQVSQPQDVLMTLLNTGTSTITVQATGGATLTGAFQVSDDGTNWIAITGYPQPSGSGVSTTTGDGYWLFPTAGHRFFQIHVTAITGIEYYSLVGTPGGTVGPAGAPTPLPANAAQETGGNLAGINSKLGSALPLATGAASATNQTTQITAEQTSATGTGAPADAAYAGSGSSSIIAATKGIYNILFHSGSFTQTSVSCGTGSTTLLAAGAATQYIGIKIPSTATSIVWINYSGTAAVAAAPSEDLAIGAKAVWTSGQNGFLPTSQINCIAASATTVTLEYK